jgi:hypothetical protein
MMFAPTYTQAVFLELLGDGATVMVTVRAAQ